MDGGLEAHSRSGQGVSGGTVPHAGCRCTCVCSGCKLPVAASPAKCVYFTTALPIHALQAARASAYVPAGIRRKRTLPLLLAQLAWPRPTRLPPAGTGAASGRGCRRREKHGRTVWAVLFPDEPGRRWRASCWHRTETMTCRPVKGRLGLIERVLHARPCDYRSGPKTGRAGSSCPGPPPEVGGRSAARKMNHCSGRINKWFCRQRRCRTKPVMPADAKVSPRRCRPSRRRMSERTQVPRPLKAFHRSSMMTSILRHS